MKNKVGSDLLNLPRREDPLEVCEVCGTSFRGLFHCQSISNITPIKEDIMSMEKRAVVETSKEKTAHKKIEKKAGTVTGRTPSGKPNQANAPKGNKDG